MSAMAFDGFSAGLSRPQGARHARGGASEASGEGAHAVGRRAAAPPGNETGNAASIGPGRLPAAARTHGRRTEHIARKSRGQTSFFCFI